MTDGVSDEAVPVAWQAVRLEYEYLRAVVLPEIRGGANNQPDFSIVMPGELHSFTRYWTPSDLPTQRVICAMR